MIKLRDILNEMEDEAKSDTIPLDDWRLTEVDYFTDIGFTQDGDRALRLHKPELVVRRKKKMTHELANEFQAVGEGYIVEDLGKKKEYTFPTFKKLVEFFDNYEQDFKT